MWWLSRSPWNKHVPRDVPMCDWAGYRVIDSTGWNISLVNTCLTDKATWNHKSQVFKLWLTHWWVLSLALLFFLSLLLPFLLSLSLSLTYSVFLFSPACNLNPKLLVKVNENWPLSLVKIRIPEEPLRSQLRNWFTMLLSYLILTPLINIWFKRMYLYVLEGRGHQPWPHDR